MIEKIKEKWDEILLHIKEEHELTDVSSKHGCFRRSLIP